jgi:thiamine transport system permease protein
MILFAAAWSFVFLTLGVLVPLGAIFQEGMRHLHGAQFSDSIVLAVVLATIKQVFWSTVFSGGIGLVLGLWLARVSRNQAHSRLLSLFSLPMVMPSVVAALGWLIWIGKSGLLARMGIDLDLAYRFEAVILAHSFYNIPWIALGVVHARRNVPEIDLDALRTLGAGRWSVFAYGVWPHLRWAWAIGCAQVMGFCAVSFALVMVLGGGPPVQTLETEVYSRLRSGGVDWSGALACAIWELVLTLLPWFLILYFQTQEKYRVRKKSIRRLGAVSSGVQHRNFDWNLVWSQGLVFMTGVFFLLPYLAVYLISWESVPDLVGTPEVVKALRFSFSLAIWSSFLTVLTALFVLAFLFHSKISVRLRSALALVFALPSGLSVIVLGLGVWIAYGRWIDPFEGSPIAMVLLQVTLFFPLAMRTLWAVASSRDPAPMDAAQSLGASRFRAWSEVEWSKWQGPLIVACGSVFGSVLGEVGAVSLFASEKWISLPGLISQSMQQYHFEEAQILSGILLTTSLIATFGAVELGDRVGKKPVP